MSRENDTICDGIRNKIGGDGGGGGGGEGDNELKKGHWRPAEDAILAKYVMTNGERNWNDLQRKGLLRRCGQSCRLRWVNHLRSNIKKGAFTPEEKSKIVRLHAEYGNRWSFLALHLPGRTDNEIKNYWYTRFKRRVRNGLPVYPPGIHQQIKCRDFYHQQPEKPPQSQKQLSASSSSSSSSFLQNLDFNSIMSSLSSSYVENPSFNCIPSSSSSLHQTNMASSSSSSVQANPDFSHIDSMSLMDPMSYPLLIASSYHPDSMSDQFNLNNDKNAGLTFSMPPPQNLPLPNSPYIPLFDESRQITSLGTNPIPQIDDAFLSENFELEIPSIHSSFPAITPTYSSTNLNNNFVLTSIDGDLSNMAPKLCLERNIMNDADEFNFDMGVKSQTDIFEDLNMMNDDNCSWLDIPPTGPPKELDELWDDSYTEPANSSNGTFAVAVDNLQDEVLCSHVSLPNGNDMTFVDELSSGFLPNDMGVRSQKDVLEGVNMTIEDNWRNWSWLDFPPNGPPNDLNQQIPMEQGHHGSLGYKPRFN